MAEVSGLSVKVSAAVSQFNAGMSRAQDAASDLSLSLRRLGMSSDAAERNLDSAGRSATTTAAQMGVLSAATNATNTSFMGLSATTIGSLIPAVVALGAALAPVIGALGGFVAVAGSIAAVGLLPAIGAIATNTEQLKTEFMDMVSVLKSEFAPVFDLAATVLTIFINEFQEIIPELVPAQSVIEELAGAFADLGSTLIDALPAFVELAVTLTQEFLPPFTQWLEEILPEIPGMVEGLVDVMDEMLPKFMEAGGLIMDLLPPLTEFGFTVLDVLGPALGFVAEEGTALLEWLDSLDPVVQKVVAAFSLLAPVIAAIGSLVGGLGILSTIVGVIGSALSAVAGPILTVAGLLGPAGILGLAVAAAVSLFVRFEDEIRNIVSKIRPILSDAINRALDWLRNTGSELAFKAMEKLGSMFRDGLDEIHNMISSPGDSIIFQAIDDMVGWLQANAPGLLNKAWDTLVDLSVAAWEGFRAGLFGEGSTGIIPQAINDVIDWLLNTATSLFTDAAATVGAALLTPFELAFNTLFNLAAEAFTSIVRVINKGLDVLPDQITSRIGFDQLEVPGLEARETDVGDVFSNRRANIQNRIEVVIEGELPEESIKEVSANRVEAVNRDTRRNQGRGTRL